MVLLAWAALGVVGSYWMVTNYISYEWLNRTGNTMEVMSNVLFEHSKEATSDDPNPHKLIELQHILNGKSDNNKQSSISNNIDSDSSIGNDDSNLFKIHKNHSEIYDALKEVKRLDNEINEQVPSYVNNLDEYIDLMRRRLARKKRERELNFNKVVPRLFMSYNLNDEHNGITEAMTAPPPKRDPIIVDDKPNDDGNKQNDVNNNDDNKNRDKGKIDDAYVVDSGSGGNDNDYDHVNDDDIIDVIEKDPDQHFGGNDDIIGNNGRTGNTGGKGSTGGPSKLPNTKPMISNFYNLDIDIIRNRVGTAFGNLAVIMRNAPNIVKIIFLMVTVSVIAVLCGACWLCCIYKDDNRGRGKKTYQKFDIMDNDIDTQDDAPNNWHFRERNKRNNGNRFGRRNNNNNNDDDDFNEPFDQPFDQAPPSDDDYPFDNQQFDNDNDNDDDGIRNQNDNNNNNDFNNDVFDDDNLKYTNTTMKNTNANINGNINVQQTPTKRKMNINENQDEYKLTEELKIKPKNKHNQMGTTGSSGVGGVPGVVGVGGVGIRGPGTTVKPKSSLKQQGKTKKRINPANGEMVFGLEDEPDDVEDVGHDEGEFHLNLDGQPHVNDDADLTFNDNYNNNNNNNNNNSNFNNNHFQFGFGFTNNQQQQKQQKQQEQSPKKKENSQSIKLQTQQSQQQQQVKIGRSPNTTKMTGPPSNKKVGNLSKTRNSSKKINMADNHDNNNKNNNNNNNNLKFSNKKENNQVNKAMNQLKGEMNEMKEMSEEGSDSDMNGNNDNNSNVVWFTSKNLNNNTNDNGFVKFSSGFANGDTFNNDGFDIDPDTPDWVKDSQSKNRDNVNSNVEQQKQRTKKK